MQIDVRTAPSGPVSVFHVPSSTDPSVAVIYVKGSNGNDANDGATPSAAVRTMARVGELLADWLNVDRHVRVVFLEKSPSPLGYPSQEMFKARFTAGRVTWESDLVEVHSPNLELTARSGPLYTFGAEAFTLDRWVGYQLQCIAAPGRPSLVGTMRTISHNTATVVTCCNVHLGYPDLDSPQVGDVFQVVTPEVAIEVSKSEEGIEPTFYGGTGSQIEFDSTPKAGRVRVQNISLRVPDGEEMHWYAIGAFEPIGCEISTDGVTPCTLSFQRANIFSGISEPLENDPGQFVDGWCLAARPRVAGGLQLRVRLDFTLADGYFVTGAMFLAQSARMTRRAGSFAASAAHPHALFVDTGSKYQAIGDNSNLFDIYRTFDQSQQDIATDNNGAAFVASLLHVGTGAIAWVGRNSYMEKGGTNIIEGSTPLAVTGWESWVHKAGKLRFSSDNANFGDVTVGSGASTFNTRADAPWTSPTILLPATPSLGEVAMRP